ncbi:MAG: hypothetical protein K6T75_10595 [Acetobacteraceae bacterium]|nr:hypothetical protein [Acetobacteraceae bacterium]
MGERPIADQQPVLPPDSRQVWATSGTVLQYSPGSKTFVPRGVDGKFAPKSLTVASQRGGTEVVAPTAAGPKVLSQK